MSGQNKEGHQLADQLEKRMPVVAGQLDRFFALQRSRFQERGASSELAMTWGKAFVEKFLMIRADRADDLKKPGVKLAQKLVREFFGSDNVNFVVDCMDGRNMPAVETSHPPHEGGIMRTAGGEFEVFRDGTTLGAVVVDMSSFKSQAIIRLLRTRQGQNIHYTWNSHFGCAARGGSEAVAGSVAEDSGLAVDIRRKMTLARGVLQIRDMLVAQGETVTDIYPEFISYDPHDGCMTVGLEAHVDAVGEEGFAPAVVEGLAAEGKIVQTWQFLHDQEVVNVLRDVVQPVDFRNRFAESMGSNWQAIMDLYADGQGAVYQKILQAVYDAYEKSGWQIGEEFNIDKHAISENVLVNKAKMLLKNLVTRWSIAQDKHEWPYDKHQEQGIVFTEGGYPPFRDIDVFSIFSQGSIVNHAYLAASLVRDFRRKGSIKDPIGMLEGNDFVKAPVIMMNKGILREMSETGWKVLEKLNIETLVGTIDWDKKTVLEDWDRSHIEARINQGFEQYPDVVISPKDLRIFIDGVYEVFDRMRDLMIDPRFRPMMIKGQAMMVNLLVDKDRRARMVLPFIA